MDDETIKFDASFPPIQSAIKRHGTGDGMRIQLDIPESDYERAKPLLDVADGRHILHIVVVAERVS